MKLKKRTIAVVPTKSRLLTTVTYNKHSELQEMSIAWKFCRATNVATTDNFLRYVLKLHDFLERYSKSLFLYKFLLLIISHFQLSYSFWGVTLLNATNYIHNNITANLVILSENVILGGQVNLERGGTVVIILSS